MFIRTHLLMWLTFAPWVVRKRAAASLFASAALCMRQYSVTNKRRKGECLRHKQHWSWTVMWERLLSSLITCGSVRSIGVASSLDELGRKAILVKRGAVYDRRIIFKRVDRGIRRHGDILQCQPQRCAALVIFELQVKPDKMETEGQVTHTQHYHTALSHSTRLHKLKIAVCSKRNGN